MWTQRFLIASILVFTTLSATAFERAFPLHAKRGTMTIATYPAIAMTINGATRTLSAGAQIKNSDNLIELPSYLPDRDFTINYTENEQGEIERVWLLSADEAQLTLPK